MLLLQEQETFMSELMLVVVEMGEGVSPAVARAWAGPESMAWERAPPSHP